MFLYWGRGVIAFLDIWAFIELVLSVTQGVFATKVSTLSSVASDTKLDAGLERMSRTLMFAACTPWHRADGVDLALQCTG